MAENNVSILKRLIQARDARAWDSIDSNISDELVIYSYSLQKTLKGKEGFRQFYDLWDKAFPDGKIEAIQLLESGDCVIGEFKGEGTQKGPFQTPFGVIQPTGRRIQLRFCDIFQFKDGKFVEHRSYLDLASALQQLGVLQLAERPKAAA